MNYDVAIVLGTGIKQDGSLPDSCLSNLKTAIKLYKDKLVSKLIFSGKWAWNCKFTPPTTEAVAMKQIALQNGIPESDTFIEAESVTIGSNLCNIKEKILIPNNYYNVALICISDVIRERMLLNLEMVLGPEYNCQIIMAESSYTPEKYQELKEIETKKIIEAKRFFENIIPGDHKLILELGNLDIQNKLKNL